MSHHKFRKFVHHITWSQLYEVLFYFYSCSMLFLEVGLAQNKNHSENQVVNYLKGIVVNLGVNK